MNKLRYLIMMGAIALVGACSTDGGEQDSSNNSKRSQLIKSICDRRAANNANIDYGNNKSCSEAFGGSDYSDNCLSALDHFESITYSCGYDGDGSCNTSTELLSAQTSVGNLCR